MRQIHSVFCGATVDKGIKHSWLRQDDRFVESQRSKLTNYHFLIYFEGLLINLVKR